MPRPGRIWYKEDRESFGEFMLSEQMRDPTAAAAGEVAAVARATAPRSEGSGGDDGHMADQYDVEREAGAITVGKQHPNPRVLVRVVNKHPTAPIVEFGNARAKKRRTLGKAGAVVGEFKGDLG